MVGFIIVHHMLCGALRLLPVGFPRKAAESGEITLGILSGRSCFLAHILVAFQTMLGDHVVGKDAAVKHIASAKLMDALKQWLHITSEILMLFTVVGAAHAVLVEIGILISGHVLNPKSLPLGHVTLCKNSFIQSLESEHVVLHCFPELPASPGQHPLVIIGCRHSVTRRKIAVSEQYTFFRVIILLIDSRIIKNFHYLCSIFKGLCGDSLRI